MSTSMEKDEATEGKSVLPGTRKAKMRLAMLLLLMATALGLYW